MINIRNIEEVQRRLLEIQESAAALSPILFKEAKKAFSTSILAADREIKNNTKTKLTRRSGALARSIKTILKGDSLDTLFARLRVGEDEGKDLIYAKVHEYGLPGGVVAKDKYRWLPGGPYLNLPLPPNKTAAGVTRMTAKQVFEEGGKIVKRPFNRVKYLLVHPVHGPMFFLTKSTGPIPARLGAGIAVEKQIPKLVRRLSNIYAEL